MCLSELSKLEFTKVIDKYDIGITIDEISNRYSERHRYFHTLDHLESIMKNLISYSHSQYYDELVLITIFHDIIYIPWADSGYSEIESANLFLNLSQSCDNELRMNVYNAILDTYNRRGDREIEQIFNRLDFGFLLNSCNFQDFIDYEHKIFSEYKFLDIDTYILNRVNFLDKNRDKNILFGDLIHYVKNRKYNIAIYPGSFNPFHVGHENILIRGEKLFDKVIIVKAVNPDKSASGLLEQFSKLKAQLPDREVLFVEGNIIEKLFVNNPRNPIMLRGLRGSSDLNYEESYLSLCKEYHPELRYSLLLCDAEYRGISSTLIREGSSDEYILNEYNLNLI
jgi:pantetheine-phosphate adenylyltransferase